MAAPANSFEQDAGRDRAKHLVRQSEQARRQGPSYSSNPLDSEQPLGAALHEPSLVEQVKSRGPIGEQTEALASPLGAAVRGVLEATVAHGLRKSTVHQERVLRRLDTLWQDLAGARKAESTDIFSRDVRTTWPLSGCFGAKVETLLWEYGLTTEATLGDLLDKIASRPQPGEESFALLAAKAPVKLVNWIEDRTLAPGHLTHAAEALGRSAPSPLAVPCLLRLLTHPSSLVREGAVYGLQAHLEYGSVRARLREVAAEDPREGVRTAAEEALE